MAIGPIEMNGVMGRTQDYAAIRSQEDQRVTVEQHAIVHHEEQEASVKSTQVQNSRHTDGEHQMGEGGGRGLYGGDGGRRRPKKEEQDGRVIRPGGFDVKI